MIVTRNMSKPSSIEFWQAVLFFLLFVWSPGASGKDDLDALLGLKAGLVDPTGSLIDWNSSLYCSWWGVECNEVDRVVRLTLNTSSLSGVISPSIVNLTSLVTLDLAGNKLTGPIPDEITRLPSLTNLWLHQNDLEGAIPSELGSSGQLEHVDLSSNFLTGNFPPEICQSKKLWALNLYNNSLTGPLPQNISLCKTLMRLNLAYNKFSGEIPESMVELDGLTILDLSTNGFSGPMPSNFSRSLSKLSLRENQLTGFLGHSWGGLKNLTLLSLADNFLEGPLPEEFGQLESLNTLHLANNRLEGTIPISLTAMRLDILDLSRNNLHGEIPKEIGRLENLSSLLLSENKLSGPIPAELQGCMRLIELELGQNRLSGKIPPAIGALTNLQYGLNLSMNILSGPIPKELGALTKLTRLDLSHNQLEGPVPPSLGELPSLLFIDLSFNRLNGTVPPFKIPVTPSQFANNPDLCFGTYCFGTGDGRGGRNGGLPTWASIVIGIGVAVSVLVLIGVVICYWRNHAEYFPNEAEPKVQSTEGRLFVDPEREQFTFENVLDATLMINDNHLIGRGRFSSVYRVVLPNGLELAIKKLKIDTENSVLSRKFVSELLKVDKMRHHNILRILGFVLRGDSLLLLYDYMPNGSLGEWLHRKPESILDWSTRYRVAVGSAQGLAYLHHNCHPPFVHRDINSNNVLLDASFEPHLGDVGLAKLYDPSKDTESMTAVAGSFGYIAPEYAYTMRVTEKSNVYSFGVVLLEMLTGRDPVERTFGEGLDLVSWVHTAAEREETPEQILDPAVSTESFHVRQEMLSVLKVAKLCTGTLPSERPKMKAVVEMLYKSKQNAVQAFQIGNLH